jgi:hypothetical protein
MLIAEGRLLFWTKWKKKKPDQHSDNRPVPEFKTAFEAAVTANRDQLEDDAYRLRQIVERISKEIGTAPISYSDDGSTSLHPKLMAELKRSENESERLLHLLRDAFRS